MQNSWIMTREDSRVDEAAKRPFSHGDAETGKTASTGDANKWKLELERLKLTYEAKTDLLESQLMLLRKDLAEYQKTCEDLKERLKHKESLLAASASSRVGGLCLKCAQHEAVLSQTHSNVHIQTIERLTKERDDLMSVLVSVRSSLAEAQKRETSAYEQVKHAVQMTEEANFEKTKALTQHDKTESEQYLLLTSQNTFLTKLKEECCLLAKKLEKVSLKSRSQIVRLSQEKRYLCDKLEKLQKRNDELEEQCIQHGRVHETMKERLRQLDKHGQATAQQLVQLLNKQNQLLLERQNLSEEVARLRAQLPSMPQSDC